MRVSLVKTANHAQQIVVFALLTVVTTTALSTRTVGPVPMTVALALQAVEMGPVSPAGKPVGRARWTVVFARPVAETGSAPLTRAV